MIGLTEPEPQSEASTEAFVVRGSAEAEARRAGPERRLQLLAEPTLELVREAERLELVPQSDSLATLECDAGGERDSSTDPFADALTAETPAPHATTLLTPDEISIPPAGDLSVEPVAERFFSEGELVAAHGAGEEDEVWDPHDKGQRKSLPHVIQRRQRLSRYVGWAVACAAVVCVAALARTTLGPRTIRVASAEAFAAMGAPAAPAIVGSELPEPAKLSEPAKLPVVAVAVAATATAPAATAPAALEVPSAMVPRVDVPKVAAVPTGDKTALQEKNDARRNLERGKLAEAIEAGERSVALDPQDGEAWLLLGAAYQEKGKNADARRCYASCLKEGKRGPLGECRAMIR